MLKCLDDFMDLKTFASAVSQIAEEKGIPQEQVMEIINTAIASAYKKEYGKKGQIIRAKLDPNTGLVQFWLVKLVVDETMLLSEEEIEALKEKPKKKEEPSSADLASGAGDTSAKEATTEGERKKFRFNPDRHIMLAEAKKIDPDAKVGEEIAIKLESHQEYGRIAAQTAKQVILQRLREKEREIIFDEYKAKEGEVISGIVQRIEGGNVYFDIGKIIGLLPREEQIPGEVYRPGQRLKLYILKVEKSSKGPVVFLSRAYPKILSKLFEIEVPEILQGQVVIKSIAREAGSRSKIAVAPTEEGIDPIGAVVGQKGTRINAVISELNEEKIDVIEWHEEPEKFIANSLSPAKVTEVKILPKNKALAIVPDDQLSLAIGKDGQNVRLAAKLTGWKIDVRSPETLEREEEEKKETEEASKVEEVKDAEKEDKKEKEEEKSK